MTRQQIKDKFADCRIEECEDGTLFIHAGGAYPLIFKSEEHPT